MKTLIILALCIVGALALTDEQKAKLSEYKTTCVAETGVDPQVVDNAKNGNVDEKDPKLQCFAACMLKKIGVMNEDGSFNEEMARKRAPPSASKEQVDELLNKCRDTTGETDCEKAAKLVKCYKENKTFSVLA